MFILDISFISFYAPTSSDTGRRTFLFFRRFLLLSLLQFKLSLLFDLNGRFLSLTVSLIFENIPFHLMEYTCLKLDRDRSSKKEPESPEKHKVQKSNNKYFKFIT